MTRVLFLQEDMVVALPPAIIALERGLSLPRSKTASVQEGTTAAAVLSAKIGLAVPHHPLDLQTPPKADLATGQVDMVTLAPQTHRMSPLLS
jgi:hypothetical protein